MRQLTPRVLLVGLSVAAFCAMGIHGQRLSSLAHDEIVQAIHWGQSGRPEAYTLRSAFPANKTPPGVVYTPYLRIALAARAAREEGRPFTPDEVTAAMTAPVIYIALGTAGDDPLPPRNLPPGTTLSMRLITDHSHPASPDRQELSPLWVRREMPPSLRFGLRPGWSYLLAAFPLEQVRADTRVELYRKHTDGSHNVVLATPGLITDADLRSWK